MNTLNEYFKKNHDPKIFTHKSVEKNQIYKQKLFKVKDSTSYLMVKNCPRSQLCYRLEAMKVLPDGVPQ